MVAVCHDRPPSREDATRSLRDEAPPTSCCQVVTSFRGSDGSTAIAGSTSEPGIASASRRRPGQPPVNGVAPDTACTMPSRPPPSSAPAGRAGSASSWSATPAAARPIVRKAGLERIAHLAVVADEERGRFLGPPAGRQSHTPIDERDSRGLPPSWSSPFVLIRCPEGAPPEGGSPPRGRPASDGAGLAEEPSA